MKKQKVKEVVEPEIPFSFEEAMRKIVQVPKQELTAAIKVRVRKRIKNDSQSKGN